MSKRDKIYEEVRAAFAAGDAALGKLAGASASEKRVIFTDASAQFDKAAKALATLASLYPVRK